MKEMQFSNINPFIRYAQFLTVTSNRQYVDLAPYDCRLFFCRGGAGVITVDGQNYEMKLGSVLCWQAGFRYSLQLSPHSTRLDLMQVNFDYTHDNCDLSDPIVPSRWQNFNDKEIVEQVYFLDMPTFNKPVYMASMPFLSKPMYNTISEFISKKNYYQVRVGGLLQSNLSLIARFSASDTNVYRSEALVDKLIQYLRSHYHEDITNQTLGERFGYHPNHLNRLLVQQTGMSVHKYLIHCRIEAAIDLIQASDLRTSEVAEAVGFRDNTHFLKYFKKITGKTTKDYRQ